MTHFLILAAVAALLAASILLRRRAAKRERLQRALAWSMAQELARLKKAGVVVDLNEKRRAG